MHEMSIAMNIIDIAAEYAGRENAVKVHEIEIEIGKLSGVEIDALTFALETATTGTILENAKTNLIVIDGRAKCLDCNGDVELENLYSPCPSCGGYNLDVITGKDLRVKSLSVD